MIDRRPTRTTLRWCCVALALAIGVAGGVASADTIRLHGSSLPLPECTVQDLRTGRLYFADPRGRRQYRDLDDVAEVTFADLPALTAAERRLEADPDAGLHAMLSALLETRSDVQRLWIRRRLLQIHDARGEYIQAASHLGALCVLREDPYWRHLAPVSSPDRPSFAAAREAVIVLHAARRRIRHRELQSVLDRLLRVIQPIHDALALGYDGPPPAAGTTLSGFPVETLRAPRRAPAAPPVVREPPTVRAPARREPPPTNRPLTPLPTAGGAVGSIESMLAAGRTVEALAACERLAAAPPPGTLGRYLLVYGQVLRAAGRPRDAAVLLARSAILHRDEPAAAIALVEAAEIHRDEFKRLDVARRLLDEAATLARERGQDDVVRRAQDILDRLPPAAGSDRERR